MNHPAAGNSEELCRSMLHDSDVVLVPGEDFGFHAKDRYMRLSYATAYHRLEEAVQRLGAFFVQ